jgi:flagellin-like protein
VSERAVSPVVGTVLMVAVVVVVATVVAGYALGFADEVSEPAPVVGESTAELVAQDGYDGGIVRITHVAGDDLAAADIELVVDADAACGKTGRLVNLPAPGGDPSPTSEYVRGDDVFDNSANSVSGAIGRAGGEWTPGDTISFRLASSECDLDPGESITVRVVHVPSDTVVVTQQLTVS